MNGIIERDGRFFRSHIESGNKKETEIAQCPCDGEWRSTLKVHVRRHQGTARHRLWASTNGEVLVEPYRPRTSRSRGVSCHLVAVDDAIRPPEPESWLIDGDGLWIKFEEDVPDRYICDPHHVYTVDKYHEVFFHHSELSEEALIAVLTCWGGLPETARECAVRLRKHDDLRLFLRDHEDMWKLPETDMDKYRTMVGEVFTKTESRLVAMDDVGHPTETGHSPETDPVGSLV